MKDLNEFYKAIADGLGAMAEGLQNLAKRVDDLTKEKTLKKAGKTKTATRKKATVSSPRSTNKVKPQSSKSLPATDQVLAVIKGSGDGVDNAKISKETGLNQTQVSSALLRLKKAGKIKSVKRGVHSAV